MGIKARRYADILAGAPEYVTGRQEEWKAFLATAARNYKYPYYDQLMIYLQRPEATACAEYDFWFDTMHRYVKRGAKGIALVDNEGDSPRLRYVFDVADTGARRNSRPVWLWQMKEEYRNPVMAALERAYGISGENQSLEAQLEQVAGRLAADYWLDYGRQIRGIVADSFLEEYDEFNIGTVFRKAAQASIAYTLSVRCTEEGENLFEPEDFRDVSDFNTRQTAAALGTAVSSISREVFREIERAIRDYERTKAQERSQNYAERNNIQAGRGLSSAGDRVERDHRETSGQIRENAQGISEGEQSDTLQRSGTGGEVISPSSGDRRDSAPEAGSADEGTSGEESSAGQKVEPDGLGTPPKQSESTGGRDNTGGTYQQLSLFPSEADQIEAIDHLEPAESMKPSAFSVPEEEIERMLSQGTMLKGGKLRISAIYAREMEPKERVRLIKEEYGISGHSYHFLDGTKGFVDADGKGIRVRNYEYDSERLLRWPEVEQRLGRMIRENRYLTAEEQESLPPASGAEPAQMSGELLEESFEGSATLPSLGIERESLEAGERKDRPIATRMVDALLTGDSVYLEGTKYIVENAWAFDVELRDPAQVYPIFRVENKDNLDRMLEQDGRNRWLQEYVVTLASTTELPPQNYRITDEHLGEGGPKAKYERNVAAIRTLFTLEQENRNATPEEQFALAQYVGWGGMPDVFDSEKTGWAQEYQELKALLSEQEYEMARASTLNAHYTSPTVIKAIYEAVGGMGFTSGNILEPSMGVGNFFGLLPDEMSGSRLYGVELDSISGRIAQKLYPNAEITVAGFETTDRRDFYDLAVGNVPFGNYRVSDKSYDKLGFSIHNYFFAKTLDQVRPGGIVAFVTSRYTMDSKNPDARRYLAQRAEMLGAIRLPNNAFKANAGTKVVSDIIFLQKREHPIDIEPEWVHLGLTPEGFQLNSFFVEHPEMVLGNLSVENTQYGREECTVEPIPGADLAAQLHQAVSRIHGQYQAAETALAERDDTQQAVPADPNVKNFSYTIVDGEVYFRENSVMRLVELNETAKGRVRGLVELRQVVNDLIEYQMEDYSEEAIRAKQWELDTLYDKFTAEYGLINSRSNAQAFADDSSYYLLCSLENINENGELESKADMFTKRTIRPERHVTSVDTPSEALAVSIGERGKVDLPFMAQLLGTPGEYDDITEGLKGVIFKDPLSSDQPEAGWQTADEYLSGNVREKLRIAQTAVKSNSAFAINVEALAKAQPKDLDASEINVRLGATWIEADDIQQFMQETFETPFYLLRSIEIRYSPITAEWQISGKSVVSKNNVAAYTTYGTERANAYRILEDTLNLKDVRVYDTIEDGDGKQKRVLNKRETMLAQQKQQAIKDAFQDWVWRDPERRERLCSRYNELFNSTRPREYDGSHIHFVGMNPDIKLRSHQLNAIAHVLYGGNVLLAHEVGAGKTFEMAASAMESKRLGLCQKSLFVVPNHLTLQWANEFLRLYPSAKLLVASKKDFETANRKKFCARIATGDYDAVIIGHSQFEKIPISVERQERLLREQIDEITNALSKIKFQRGDSFTIKQMEKTRKSLQARLDKLLGAGRKDDVITFEQLGVDRLFVDESHAFKNLFLFTKMRNVAGLSTSEAQKSQDMFLKCRYMDELTGGRGVVFATGTPVSNSMTELYTVMRYLQYGTLQQKGLTHFDCWASTFGETTTAIELAPEGTGYRARTRFAKFFNLPELMAMFKEVADIKTSDQLNLPVPEAKFETVVVQPSEHQQAMVAELSERAAAVHSGTVDSSVDNMLKITSDGRKLGLDQRLMNPLLPDDPGSKVNACVSNVLRIWEEGKEERLTQLLFCDLSTPKNDGTFNVYDDIRSKLIAAGVPEQEIAFIHTADTEAKKKELFAKVRSGQVRILMGSTQKMGAGTNVQDRLIAVHHLDVGWRPSDMTQRNGRIIRQGNQNKQVKIYQYVTEKTFDAYLFQTLENKQKFISQIMTSKSPARSCDDVDEQALSYAEIKALCAGDPQIKEKMDLDIEVARLKVLKADHMSQRFRLEDRLLKYFPAEIEKNQELIRGLTADIQTVAKHPHPADGFAGMIIGETVIAEKADAGKAIILACRNLKGDGPTFLGEYRGFAMELCFNAFSKEFEIVLKGSLSHRVSLGEDARGNLIRMDNVLAGLPNRLERVKDELANLENQRGAAREELQKPFSQEQELSIKSARLAELDAILNMDDSHAEEDISEARKTGRRPSVLAELKSKSGHSSAQRHDAEREVAL